MTGTRDSSTKRERLRYFLCPAFAPNQQTFRQFNSKAIQEKSSIMHCGQLKLLCMETAFLTKWASPGDLVVYIGGGICPSLDMHLLMFGQFVN